MVPIAVTEVHRALGSFSLNLSESTPQWMVDLLDQNRFGRIVVDSGRDNPTIIGDPLLRTARYVGVLRGTERQQGQIALNGCGMAFWLGNEDQVGDNFETPVIFTGSPFESVIPALLPPGGAVTAGTIRDPSGGLFPGPDVYPGPDLYPSAGAGYLGGQYKGHHQYQSSRQAIDYVCDLFKAEWRVNGDSTLDAGAAEALFYTTPRAAVVRRSEGADMQLRGLPGLAKLARDVNDYSTRVVTLAQGQGASVAVGRANIEDLGLSNPYVDPHGNPVKLTRFVSESNTSLTNANARAQVALAQYVRVNDVVTLNSTTHDIRGDVAPGDSVWIYDETAALIDTTNEIVFRGERIWPVKLRVFSLTWSIERGMGVYFRTGTGTWLDLTDYVVPETSGSSTITVGGYDRSLTNYTTEQAGSRVVADSSIPGVPTLGPIQTNVYLSTGGKARARLIVPWTQPLNTDGTVIQDGDHYEIQIRTPSGTGTWASYGAAFDQSSTTIAELTPSTEYGVRIRAFDCATPPNIGAFSAEVSAITAGDSIAPATPAAPMVEGNPLAIQVISTLGRADGGIYNMDTDLAYFEVHGSLAGSGFDPDTSPDVGTQIGKLTATYSMIAATVPAIGTFTVPQTAALWIKLVAVDTSGNRSAPSDAATATATLIDSQYVSSLTATKIVAGDLSATIGLLGLLRTATGGARFEAGVNGFLNGARTYRPSGTLALQLDAITGDLVTYQTDGIRPTFRVQASSGNVYMYGTDGLTPALSLTAATGLIDMRGKLTAGATAGDRIVVDPTYTGNPGRTGDPFPTIVLGSAYGTSGSGSLNATWVVGTTTTAVGLNSGPSTTSGTYTQTTCYLFPNVALLSINAGDGQTVRGGYVKLTATSTALGLAPSGTDAMSVFMTTASGGSIQVTGPGGNALTLFGSGATQLTTTGNNYLLVNPTGSQLVSNGTVKSFVIDHPTDPSRLLVHACTEGPVSGVEYQGWVEVRDHRATAELPAYFEALCLPDGRSVFLQPEIATFDGMPMVCGAAPGPIVDGRFDIVCPGPDGTRVHWLVKATRRDAAFDVEPLRSQVTAHGDGPYRYLTPRLGVAA